MPRRCFLFYAFVWIHKTFFFVFIYFYFILLQFFFAVLHICCACTYFFCSFYIYYCLNLLLFLLLLWPQHTYFTSLPAWPTTNNAYPLHECGVVVGRAFLRRVRLSLYSVSSRRRRRHVVWVGLRERGKYLIGCARCERVAPKQKTNKYSYAHSWIYINSCVILCTCWS